LSNPLNGLIGSKNELSAPPANPDFYMKTTDKHQARQTKSHVVPALLAGVAMLAIWAYVTITTIAPGWVHILLTAGVFLLIYGIAARGSSRPPPPRN
jgi:uncharacterized membrane protein